MQPPSSLTSGLYCAEDAADVASWVADTCPPFSPQIPISPPSISDLQCPISDLLASELNHMPLPDYIVGFHNPSLDSIARQDAINWMLKVHAFYRFLPLTAYLAVNYLDRFLSSNTLPQGSRWTWQLLSVACLSVAAKMEETNVPLLLDLQILEPRFVFEPPTVRRMELLLMAALRWRMRSVTPFDFVGYFARMLPGDRYAALFSRVSDLVLRTLRVADFLGYRPSAIAAAAVLCAAGEIGDISTGEDGDIMVCFESVSKEMVRRCRQLMDEYLIDTCPSAERLKEEGSGSEPLMPRSPVGVLDAAACGSCDSQVSVTTSETTLLNPGTSQAEPTAKRRRLGMMRCRGSIGAGDNGANL